MEKGRNLKGKSSHKNRDKDPQLIYGKRAIEEAFLAGRTFEKLYLQRDLKGEFVDQLMNSVRETKTALSKVPIEKLNRITRRSHQGIVGYLSLISYSSLHHIISACFDQGDDPLVVLLDEITDVRNIGSIARSSECAGVHALVLPLRGSGMINGDAMKTSAGALHHLPVCKEKDLVETCKYLQNSGLQIIACSEKGNVNYFEADMTAPTALIMGAEDVGISNQLLRIADHHVSIPMKGKVGSLNVSNATSVLLFEANRQRNS